MTRYTFRDTLEPIRKIAGPVGRIPQQIQGGHLSPAPTKKRFPAAMRRHVAVSLVWKSLHASARMSAMTLGPGKYDPECTQAMSSVDALACILIVVTGNRGDGFSMQTVDPGLIGVAPALLRLIADQIEAEHPPMRVVISGEEAEGSGDAI